MNLLWPASLFLLLLIPVIVAAYIWMLRRRRRFAIRYSSLALVRDAAGKQSWLRRHLSFLLFLSALTSLVFALTRPTATVVIPSNRATIILAMDVSLSMCSTDIPPNRLQAAKDAALTFVENRDSGTKIGIVAFAGFSELVQPPTEDRELLSNAIQYLTTARRTAIGSAILRSIEAISEVDDSIPSINLADAGASFTPATEYAPHIIVLLTDGSSNAGPSPFVAATEALKRGIRVYTIGFGTMNNTSPMDCGFSLLETDQFTVPNVPGFGGGGAPFFGGGGFRRELDEAALQQIADMTGGTYYAATSAGELQDVFQNLPTYLVVTREKVEIGAFFNALAVLLILAAVFLSLRWNPLM
jgi:Ca-activated chloride channel family protein